MRSNSVVVKKAIGQNIEYKLLNSEIAEKVVNYPNIDIIRSKNDETESHRIYSSNEDIMSDQHKNVIDNTKLDTEENRSVKSFRSKKSMKLYSTNTGYKKEASKRCFRQKKEIMREEERKLARNDQKKSKEYQRKYRMEKKNKAKEYQYKYRMEKKDKAKEYQLKYRNETKDKAKKYQLKYRREKKEYYKSLLTMSDETESDITCSSDEDIKSDESKNVINDTKKDTEENKPIKVRLTSNNYKNEAQKRFFKQNKERIREQEKARLD